MRLSGDQCSGGRLNWPGRKPTVVVACLTRGYIPQGIQPLGSAASRSLPGHTGAGVFARHGRPRALREDPDPQFNPIMGGQDRWQNAISATRSPVSSVA